MAISCMQNTWKLDQKSIAMNGPIRLPRKSIMIFFFPLTAKRQLCSFHERSHTGETSVRSIAGSCVYLYKREKHVFHCRARALYAVCVGHSFYKWVTADLEQTGQNMKPVFSLPNHANILRSAPVLFPYGGAAKMLASHWLVHLQDNTSLDPFQKKCLI